MDEIEDWYRHLGAIPVSEWSPTGIDPRDTPLFEDLRREIMKSGIPNAGAVDWRLVVDYSVRILSEQSKDLQVACYLCRGLADSHGYPGLAAGLAILRDLVAHYWETMFPEKRRGKARIAALDWLTESLYGFFEHRRPLPVDHRAVDRSLDILADLEAELAIKLRQQAPPLGYLRRQIADHAGRMKVVHPLPPQARTPASPPPAAVPAMMERSLPSVPPPHAAAPPPSRPIPPWIVATDRLASQTRRWKILGSLLTLLLLTSLAGAYYALMVRPVARIVARLEAQAGHFDDTAVRLIATLPPERRQEMSLRFSADLADYHLERGEAALERTDFIAAEDELETAREIAPRSPRLLRLAEALAAAPGKLPQDLLREISASRDSLLVQAGTPAQREQAERLIRQLTQALTEDDGRTAREIMAKLLTLLGDDRNAAVQVERYLTRVSVQRAEQLAEGARFSKALQALSTGLVATPQSAYLRAAQRRTETARSIYLLRQMVGERIHPDAYPIRQAFAQVRQDAPRQWARLDEDLRHKAEETASLWAVQDGAAALDWLKAIQAVAPQGSRVALAMLPSDGRN